MKIKKNNIVPFIIIGILITVSIILISKKFIKAEYTPNYDLEDYYKKPKENLKINEYIPVTITEQSMAQTYYNTYTSKFLTDINEAYRLLDNKSKQVYKNIDRFKEKVNTITNGFQNIPRCTNYTFSNESDNDIYTITDENGNKYTFITTGVMQYTVIIN